MYLLQNWFDINSNTGDVTVNNKLDRDKVIRWSATVKVQDMNGGANQTATGKIIRDNNVVFSRLISYTYLKSSDKYEEIFP